MTAKLTHTTIPDIVRQQRQFFASGQTKPAEFRLQQLHRLKQAILDRRAAIIEAVYQDLGRPEFEAYYEIYMLGEVNKALKQLKQWMKPQKVGVGIEQMPGAAWLQPDPLGVVFIVGPWNYPFQLVASPLVGAIAAGNCAILKPSESAPCTSKLVAEMVASTFDPHYVTVVEGDAEVSQQLLRERFDHIFFTGGPEIGRKVMQEAAKTLTPVTLELGGKNPCIVESDVKLEVAARRIVWGKFINAGQTCLAPDYLLVDRRVKDPLLAQLNMTISEFYGDTPSQSPDYGRIVNQRHFDRLQTFLEDGDVAIGGDCDRQQRYIGPTVLDNISWDAGVMQEEIFGPILPVLTYEDLDEAIARINERPKPLALYVFSSSKSVQNKLLQSTSSGGVYINDTVIHNIEFALPFGGVGQSGMGAYHGKYSFDTFSHYKPVLKKGLWFDVKLRYAPYTDWALKLIKFWVTRS